LLTNYLCRRPAWRQKPGRDFFGSLGWLCGSR